MTVDNNINRETTQEDTMPNTTTTETSAPTQTPRIAPVTVAAIVAGSLVAALTGSITAVVIADHNATQADQQVRQAANAGRTLPSELANACIAGQVRWTCGVDRIESVDFNDHTRQLVVHVNTDPNPDSTWKHQPPAIGYNNAAREILRTSPVGTSQVIIANHRGTVIGYSEAQGPSL